LFRCAHLAPAGDLVASAQTTETEPVLIQRADFSAWGFGRGDSHSKLGRDVELWGVLAYSSNAQSEPEQELEGQNKNFKESSTC
jgi:hypothetical protein